MPRPAAAQASWEPAGPGLRLAPSVGITFGEKRDFALVRLGTSEAIEAMITLPAGVAHAYEAGLRAEVRRRSDPPLRPEGELSVIGGVRFDLLADPRPSPITPYARGGLRFGLDGARFVFGPHLGLGVEWSPFFGAALGLEATAHARMVPPFELTLALAVCFVASS